MKTVNTYIKSLVILGALCFGFASCEDQPTAFELADGVPEVHYIRYADRDVIITEAYMDEAVCIVGDNLRSIRELYFNDQKATLNTSYMTDHTLLVNVPKEMAVKTTDLIYMITSQKDTIQYNFRVMPPAPVIKSMSNEWAAQGSTVTLYGDYFVSTEDFPISIEFPNAEITDFESVTKTAVTFKIPAAATEGKIKVTTLSGTSYSTFHYRDSRGIITNFDGATDVVPQGWNIKVTYSDEGGIDGKYVIIGPGSTPLDEDGAWNEEYKLPFWCGNWNGNPMGITSGPGVPICNFIDFTNFKNMGIKFEINIPKENPWKSAAMQIVFTDAETCANDSWQNNDYIQPAQGLCRALWRPWEATGSYDTNGEWITVTIPFTDFRFNADGTEGKVALKEASDFASLVIWPWSGGVKGTECTPIFKIDNIRAVPVK